MPRKRSRRRRKTRNRKTRNHWLRRLLWRGFVLACLGLAVYVVYLDFSLRQQFEGKRWAVPARVYARPLEIYEGLPLSMHALVRELRAMGYQSSSSLGKPGTYWRAGNDLHLVTREFEFWDGVEPSRRVALRVDEGGVSGLRRSGSGADVALVRLEPILIGGIYPAHREDRVLVQLEDVPKQLVGGLLAVEDREFFTHHGIVPTSILRALWANLRAGKTVQGGSTLTQQLAKNLFLSRERSLVRKANEAIMALLLEWHYDKQEILEAYLNEVYLGQSGQRAIHGFGLASRFYFGRPLEELNLAQTALLVGVIKGPSYYDPRRHPQRATKRRNLVLTLMREQGLITQQQLARESKRGLQLIPRPRSSVTDYPAYLDFVKRQLRRDYRDEDLRSEGLQIFTSFDPHVQWQVENSLKNTIRQLESQRKLTKGNLQGAVVVTSADQGEVLAMTGGRDPRQDGFNRALDAVRPVGSLMKPAVYLTALEQGYTLASKLDDSQLVVEMGSGKQWQPANYDKQYHGEVLLRDALIHSYNISTVRLGQQLGMDRVADTLEKLGVYREVHRFPSLPLGTAALSPVEVTQMYQVFAAGGFRSPLRAIRDVLDKNGKALQRYPLTVEQAVTPGNAHLLNTTLRGVVEEGTAGGLAARLPFAVAGKTGTTDDLRDSWFAGFSGAHVAVVWLGNDDNRAIRLTGASGAMQVWGDIIAKIPTRALELVAPEDVSEVWIDRPTGLRGSEDCKDALVLPFIRGTEPRNNAPCAGGGFADTVDRFFGIFGNDE